MNTVNSVLGPLETNKIGVTLMHEHLLASAAGIPQIYPELLGKDYKNRLINGLMAAKHGGIDTILDATTIDLGRDVKLLAEVSQQSGVNIIACAGWNLEIPHFLGTFTADQYAQIFAREVREGIEGTNIKAGILKSASDYEGVTPQTETILRGIGRAQLMTGVPIMLHSYAPGQVGRQQLAILKEEGVDLRRVKVDHVLDTTDMEYLTWILEQGCFLGVDRLPEIARSTSLNVRIKTIKALIDAGYENRLILSHDTVLVSTLFDNMSKADKLKIVKDNPDGLLFIHKVVLPKLRELGVSEKTIQGLMVDNPRRFFEGKFD